MKTIFENIGSQYERQGDYILPKLKIEDKNKYCVGVLGQRYRRYLKGHHLSMTSCLICKEVVVMKKIIAFVAVVLLLSGCGIQKSTKI